MSITELKNILLDQYNANQPNAYWLFAHNTWIKKKTSSTNGNRLAKLYTQCHVPTRELPLAIQLIETFYPECFKLTLLKGRLRILNNIRLYKKINYLLISDLCQIIADYVH